MKSNVIAASVLVLAAGVGCSAQAQEFKIKDAVARVVVIPENRTDVAVEISGGSGVLPALRRRDLPNGGVELDGGLDRQIGSCSRTGLVLGDAVQPTSPPSNLTVDVRGRGKVRLADAPLVTVRVPMDAKVSSGGAVFGSVGRSRTLRLSNAGCGDWSAANVEGELTLSQAGSGDVRAGSAGTLRVSIAGSGDVRAGAVGALRTSVAGSGDVTVARVAGPVEASIAGSGDVRVESGRATTVKVSIAGSGDFEHRGEADSLNASIVGSGDVRVSRVTGEVRRSVMGSGSVVTNR